MYKRSWKLNLLPNFFEPVFYLTSIGVGVGAYINEMAGMSYAEFLAPGLVCVAAMNGASFEVTYNVFVRMEFEKSYDAMLTTPIEPVDILMGELLWAMTRSCIYGLCFFLVVSLFGLAAFPNALLALLAIPLTGFLFGAIGLAFTMLIRNIDLYSFYFTLFLTPLFLFSGVFFPLEERLSGLALLVAEVLPLLHPVRFARSCFLGNFDFVMLWDLFYCVVLAWLLLLWASKRIRSRLSQ
jgi:lipooligosaccharide transport system permease protein